MAQRSMESTWVSVTRGRPAIGQPTARRVGRCVNDFGRTKTRISQRKTMTVGRITMVLAALVALSAPAWAGLGSKDAKYLGGTLKVKEGQEGKTSTSDEKVFTFEYKKGEKVS